MPMLKLNPEDIDLGTLRSLWGGESGSLDDAAMERIANSAAAVERIVAGGETVYGVNTGFGSLANTRIPAERLAELQTNLILSHSAGLGDPLPRRGGQGGQQRQAHESCAVRRKTLRGKGQSGKLPPWCWGSEGFYGWLLACSSRGALNGGKASAASASWGTGGPLGRNGGPGRIAASVSGAS